MGSHNPSTMKTLIHLLTFAALGALAVLGASQFPGQLLGDSINVESTILVLTSCFVGLLSLHDYGRRSRPFEVRVAVPRAVGFRLTARQQKALREFQLERC